MNSKIYVLITPAKNEEEFIGKTIESVLAQTIRPHRWIIVSDGSTDSTDAIVSNYASQYSFIAFLNTSSQGLRNFGSKVNAFNAGYKELKNTRYDFIGNLDADVTFEPRYFENILNSFSNNPGLGMAGGIIQELVSGKYVDQNISLNSVAGAVQLFRRECFEEIGGYIPIRTGGIDAAAEIVARMHGWAVRTFPEYKVLHHRRVAGSTGNILISRFRQGIMYYALGYHPVFQTIRCLYKVTDKPYFGGSIFLLSGYFWACLRKQPKSIPANAITYLREEQMKRLRSVLCR